MRRVCRRPACYAPVVASPAYATRPATRADLDALPSSLKGELIGGVLYAMTRPRPRHQGTAANILDVLRAPFHHGRGGPGGWLIIPEPGISLPGAEAISPDVAGWRRERMPSLPREGAFTLVPDWVCEVVSPTTRRHDSLVKSPFYAAAGVPWMWLVDVEDRLVTTYRNEGGSWAVGGPFGDETEARIAPFEAAPIDLTAWWAELGSDSAP